MKTSYMRALEAHALIGSKAKERLEGATKDLRREYAKWLLEVRRGCLFLDKPYPEMKECRKAFMQNKDSIEWVFMSQN